MNRRLAQGLDAEVQHADHPSVQAVVALGANLGDRARTLAAAIDELRLVPLVDAVRPSQLVESVAVKPDGPDAAAPAYLNGVALLTTRLAPTVLLSYLQAIEARHGRVRDERWGDRTLDLDLIAFGDVRSSDPHLLIPHPRAREREFVLGPWLSLDPDAELPGAGRIDLLLERLRAAR
jgi:2-amino-4-hydroxy-6-hydroxymethyldihydropteridine diphosphokinase